MRNGPISVNTHAAIEPFVGLFLILSPWIFGFSENNDAKWVAIVIGALVIAGGMMTRWRYSLVKLIPLNVHFMWDLLIGAALIVSPFAFGFSDDSTPTIVLIAFGIAEIAVALMTRWVPESEFEHQHPTRGAHA